MLGFDERLKESETDTFFDNDDAYDDDAALVTDLPAYDTGSDRDGLTAQPKSTSTGAPPALPTRPRSDSSPLDPDVIPTTATIEVRTGSHGGTKRQPPAVPPHRSVSRPPVAVQPAAEEGADHLRERSASDPFLDPGDRRRPILPMSVSPGDEPLAQSTTPPPLPARHLGGQPPTSPTSTPLLTATSSQSNLNPVSTRPLPSSTPARTRRPSAGPASADPPPQFRVFTAPAWLTDPELRALAALFPEWGRMPKAGLIKLAANASGSKADEESVVGGSGGLSRSTSSGSSGVGRGHGEVRVGEGGLRDEGWRGTRWERFVGWWKRLFGRG